MDSIQDRKEKKNKYQFLVKNTALFSISSLGSKVIVFLMLPLYTQVLSTEDYGTVDLISATASLLIPVLTLNIQDAIMRFILEDDNETSDVLSTGIRIVFFGTFVFVIVLTILKSIHIIKYKNVLLIYLFCCYFFGALNNCFSLYLKGKERVNVLALSGIINSGLLCILNIVLLVIFRFGLYGYMIAHVITLIITVLYQIIFGEIYKDIKFNGYENLSKKMLTYSSPLIGNSIAWWINNVSDRYILTFMQGIAINGIYSISYKIPAILSMIQGIFNNAWSISAITEFDSEDSDGFIGNVYGTYAGLSILGCSIIMMFNIPIARVLYAKEFFQAWQYVPFLLVGTMFNGMALFLGCLFTAAKKTKEVSKSTIIGALVNTIGNVIFIYLWGAQGAAVATLAGYLVTWMMRLVLLRNIVYMKLNWKNHLISCGLMIMQACFALNSNWTIQCIIFLLIAILQKEYMYIIAKRMQRIIKK